MPRHDLDHVSLVFGLAFAGVAIVFLLDEGTKVSARWAWPVLLIVLGVIGLFASRSRRPEG